MEKPWSLQGCSTSLDVQGGHFLLRKRRRGDRKLIWGQGDNADTAPPGTEFLSQGFGKTGAVSGGANTDVSAASRENPFIFLSGTQLLPNTCLHKQQRGLGRDFFCILILFTFFHQIFVCFSPAFCFLFRSFLSAFIPAFCSSFSFRTALGKL